LRRSTIRSSLLRSLLLLIVFLAAATLGTTVFSARTVRADLSRALIAGALEHVEGNLRAFFDPVGDVLELARNWAATGVFDPWDFESLNRVFIPLLQRYPQVSSINLADASGRGTMLLRTEGRWLNRRVGPESRGDRIDFAEWQDVGKRLRAWSVEAPTAEQRYDPRSREWYTNAAGPAAHAPEADGLPEAIHWTRPYTFFTTREPGITASIPIRGPGGEALVVAADLLLGDLSDFTRHLDVSPHGMAFVLDDQSHVIGLPRHSRFDDPAVRQHSMLAFAKDLGIPILADGTAAFRALGPAAPDVFSFESDATVFWAGIRTFPLGGDRSLRTVVAVPEGDLLAAIVQQRQVILGVFAAALLLAGLLALGFARRFSQPLVQLAGNSQRIGALDLTPAPPIETHLVEIDQLAGEQERMRIALDAFARYVPIEVVRGLLERGEAARIGGSRRSITILFSDIVDFTKVAEATTPEALTARLAVYFDALLNAIREDGHGEVSQIVGDGVVALWGAPVEDDDHPVHAVEAVLRCQQRLELLNAEWARRGLTPLPTRFGLATGPTVVGNVGAPTRLSYTAVGDSMNLASRVEGLNRFYGTCSLATGELRDLTGQRFAWRHVDRVRVKGRDEPVEIFEILGRTGEVAAAELAFADRYEQALAAYRARDVGAALPILEGLIAERAGDASVQHLLASCQRLRQQPPGDDWDFTTRFTSK